MKTQKTLQSLFSVVAAVLLLNAHVVLGVSNSVTNTTGLSTGQTDVHEAAITYATVNVVVCNCPSGNTCYQPVVTTPYSFSIYYSMLLPQVGQTYNGGYFDQTFYDTTRTHETGHLNYDIALADKTYGTLEAWSANYIGGCFLTSDEALSAGQADMANALTTAQNAYMNNLSVQDTWPTHANSGWFITDIGGTPTYRSTNENWATIIIDYQGKNQSAIDYANSIAVSFAITPGDCQCIPEPSSWAMLLVGSLGLLILARRKLLA
jgi:hypothetical protein